MKGDYYFFLEVIDGYKSSLDQCNEIIQTIKQDKTLWVVSIGKNFVK